VVVFVGRLLSTMAREYAPIERSRRIVLFLTIERRHVRFSPLSGEIRFHKLLRRGCKPPSHPAFSH
jgi:hypothetical protein